MNNQPIKPLTFGATMLASALGVLIVSVVCTIVMFVASIAMMAVLSTVGSKDTATVRSKTFVHVNLERISGDRTADRLSLSFGDNKTVGLIDAAAAIRAAASDDNVAGLYVTDPGTSTLSFASLTELRAAIADFRQSGKPVISYATGYSQPGYYLCSVADTMALHPAGMVDFRGMGAQVIFYKELFDKLGVEMQLIRPESCAYKSAGEVYTRSSMSTENREQIRAYISSIWNTVLGQIAESRSLSTSSLNSIADNLGGYLATDAYKSHLVDTLCFEADIRDALKRLGGRHLMTIDRYATAKPAPKNVSKNVIAVVYAEGNVVDGSARGFNDAVYGDDIVASLRKATKDDNVKAIVMRVNSPGGAATASESMTHAVIEARKAKPVIVSMGDLAASAGYEMSCMADYIVAQPTTITGSIGVFATLPNVGTMMSKKLGLTVDTANTNRNATGLTVYRQLSPAARALMIRNVEDFYKTFVSRVAEGRGMTFDEVHRIARGRVWTGADAIKIGLVDTLGGFDLALAIAAQKAGIEDYRVVNYPKEVGIWNQLNAMLGDNGSDDINLLAKMRLAWQWRGLKKNRLEQLEQPLSDLTQVSGLQARMPFVVMDY